MDGKVNALKIVDRLIELTEAEHALETSENVDARAKFSAKELEARGMLLNNMQITSVASAFGGKVILECCRHPAYGHQDEPIQGFSSGDTVSISDVARNAKGKQSSTSSGDSLLQGVVARVSRTKLVVACSEETDIPDFERCAIHKLSDDATYRRQLATLKKLAAMVHEGKLEANHLHSVLLGLAVPTMGGPVAEVAFLDQALNEAQQSAVVAAMSAEVLAIHGPPGTGKTSTLVEVIRQTVLRHPDSKLLVAAASNLAVDNLMTRLVAHRVPVTRIGHPARVLEGMIEHTFDAQSLRSDAYAIVKDLKADIDASLDKLRLGGKHRIRGKERQALRQEVKELRRELSKREVKIAQEVFAAARVILTTCHGAGSRLLQGRDFDLVIIDEAAAAVEPACWVAALKGRRLVLAGDHLQLPPMLRGQDSERKKGKGKAAATPDRYIMEDKQGLTDTEHPHRMLGPPRTLAETMFARLIATFPETRFLLNIQYRFNGEINAFPSRTLYDNELLADASVTDRSLLELVPSSDDDDLEQRVVFLDTAGLGTLESGEEGESKWNENEATIVHDYVKQLIAAGVPSSSIAVISPYKSQVSFIGGLLRTIGVEVGSVDSWQGREQEVIIISLVRSNDAGEVGFLRDSRRLNVAMTRAKRQLVVVGDSQTVKQGSKFLAAWMSWLEQHADVRVPDL